MGNFHHERPTNISYFPYRYIWSMNWLVAYSTNTKILPGVGQFLSVFLHIDMKRQRLLRVTFPLVRSEKESGITVGLYILDTIVHTSNTDNTT